MSRKNLPRMLFCICRHLRFLSFMGVIALKLSGMTLYLKNMLVSRFLLKKGMRTKNSILLYYMAFD